MNRFGTVNHHVLDMVSEELRRCVRKKGMRTPVADPAKLIPDSTWQPGSWTTYPRAIKWLP